MARPKRKTKSQEDEVVQASLDLAQPEDNALVAQPEKNRSVASEKAVILGMTEEQVPVHNLNGDYQSAPLKNGASLMHFPFFPAKSYAAPRYHTFEQASEKVTLELVPNPMFGGPSISDADVIKFCISGLNSDAKNNRVNPNIQAANRIREFKFTARDFFAFTKRDNVGGSQLTALRNALNRLKSINVNFYRTPKDPAIASKIERVANHSSFILDWTEVSLTGYNRENKNSNDNVIFTVKFPEWMAPFFYNNETILTLNRSGFFFLEAVEKKWYECLRSMLGYQAYVKIRLKTLALRVDYQPDEDGVFKGRNLNYIRDELYRMIASDDLIGISMAVEPMKPGAEELVYIFRSNWKHKKSQVVDPADPSKKLTKLEAAIFKKEGLLGLKAFRGQKTAKHPALMRTEDIRKIYKDKKYRKWIDKYEKDQDILKRGDAIERGEGGYKPLTGREQKRYDRIKLCENLASSKPKVTPYVDVIEDDDGVIDIIED